MLQIQLLQLQLMWVTTCGISQPLVFELLKQLKAINHAVTLRWTIYNFVIMHVMFTNWCNMEVTQWGDCSLLLLCLLISSDNGVAESCDVWLQFVFGMDRQSLPQKWYRCHFFLSISVSKEKCVNTISIVIIYHMVIHWTEYPVIIFSLNVYTYLFIPKFNWWRCTFNISPHPIFNCLLWILKQILNYSSMYLFNTYPEGKFTVWKNV